MANKKDVLLKYKTAYTQFEKQSKDRLEELKRFFSNEKQLYQAHLDELNNELHQKQERFYNQISDLHKDYLEHQDFINEHYNQLKSAFNEEIYREMSHLDEQSKLEDVFYDEILEEFEQRKQDALDIYLTITKQNNEAINNEMKIHRDFINQENQKLLKYKQNYENLSAELTNKMLWTIEKSKNSIEKLQNDLDKIGKEDLFTLNQKILNSLSDMRGARNDINIIFKKTSQQLELYKEEILELRKVKQKPYAQINHRLIHKLIQQIRLANENKNKYQAIIKTDLQHSLDALYPRILKAYQQKDHDNLEKYILQTEILQEKAAFLIQKIEKITNYNISTYQKRIKEIKVETFSYNEEVKFTYGVPVKYIDHAINIYSNYNFYFNQGFSELDTLLSKLISFSQQFNDLRNTESIQIKDDLSSYQNNYLARVQKISDHLADLLYHIDEIAFQITTLESSVRLEIGEIKKEIVNVDLKGDYLKYLETLSSDYNIAKNEYNIRLKTLNIHKLYYDRIHELYQSAVSFDQDKSHMLLSEAYQAKLIDIESATHLDHYDYTQAHFDIFFTHQAKMVDWFMKIMKLQFTQTLKASNYHLAKGYFDYEAEILNDQNQVENQYLKLQNTLTKAMRLNQSQTEAFLSYLDKEGNLRSTVKHFESLRLKLKKQLDFSKNQKIESVSQSIIDAYQAFHKTNDDIHNRITNQISGLKLKLYNIQKKSKFDITELEKQLNYRELLYTFTSSYYQAMTFNYKHRQCSSNEKLQDFFDDSTIFIIEKSIHLFDSLKNTKNQAKQRRKIESYIIQMLECLNQAYHRFMSNNQQTFDRYLSPLIHQIASIELDIEHQNKIIESHLDHLSKKTLNQQHTVMRQKNVIQEMSNDLLFYMQQQIDISKHLFESKNKSNTHQLKAIKRKVTALIRKNDKALIKIHQDINQLFANQYLDMTNDYQDQIKTITTFKDKIIFDRDVEKTYLHYITTKRIKENQVSKHHIYQAFQQIPIDRHSRLQNIKNAKQTFFDEQQLLLHRKLRDIEKDKFSEIPKLEKKIIDKENSLKASFESLYQKHQALEENYLNQYTKTNSKFSALHEGFQKNLVKSKFRYDKTLNEPLKDLLKTETSIIKKVDKINLEISSKTKQKSLDIRTDKLASQNKQDRIIHS